MSTLFWNVEDLQDNHPTTAAQRDTEDTVILVSPDYFDVAYVTNAHTRDMVGTVNKDTAWKQWDNLKAMYANLGINVEVLPGRPNLPDQVFTANTSLSHKTPEGVKVLLSNMALDTRKPEVDGMEEWVSNQGQQYERISNHLILEGMGDGIWHPGRAWLYIGYGHRTQKESVEYVQQYFDVPVVPLQLVSELFYHLDVALAPINQETVLIYPEAFTQEGRDLINACFSDVIEVPKEEAMNFVLNGHSPNGTHFIVHKGSPTTKAELTKRGIEVLEINTSEYIKAGGSVFCMKMMTYR